MEHLIRFRTAEGIDGSHVAKDLDEAVSFVERLRNTEDATDVRLFRLTEIAIEFKPYYRVEVGGVEAKPDPVVAPAAAKPRTLIGAPPPAMPGVMPFAEPAPVVRADDASETDGPELPEGGPANGRRLFSRT